MQNNGLPRRFTPRNDGKFILNRFFGLRPQYDDECQTLSNGVKCVWSKYLDQYEMNVFSTKHKKRLSDIQPLLYKFSV